MTFRTSSYLLVILLGTLVSFSASAGVKYGFKPITPAFDSVAEQLLEREFYFRSTPDVNQALSTLHRVAETSGNSQLKARAIFWEARTGQLRGKPDEQIAKLEKARSMSAPEYEYDNAFINYQLAGNYQRLGKYFTTYQLLQQAIPVFEKSDDDYALGNAYLLLALTYREIGEIEQAMENIDAARRHYARAGFPLNRIYFFQALTEPDVDKSLKHYKMSAAVGAHEPPMSVQALINISKIFLDKQLPDSAAFYADKAAELIKGPLHDNEIFQAILSHQQAEIALKEGRYKDVITYCDFIEKISEKYPGEHLAPSLYLFRSRALESLGRFDEAFHALKKHQQIQDENLRTLEAREIPKAREREAIARQKEVIAEVRRLEQSQRNRLYIWLLALGVLLVASAGLLIYLWQRAKIRKIKNRELRSNLEQQMALARFNRENFEKDMQKKECEISTSVLLLSNKNDVLQRISDITREYSDAGRIPQDYVNSINEAVGSSLRNDDDWSRFKLHFEGVHPSFFIKLKEKSDELTENDLRLCAYLRIGMRAKEIAGMLAVSPASINTARYRLRKKLGLGKEDSLDDFIRKI